MSSINKNFPLDKAELVGFLLESLLYGFSVLLFIATIFVLIYHRRTERLNTRLVIISSLMMLFGTIHISIDFLRMLEGFIDRRDHPGGPIAYFGKLFEWSHLLKTSIFVVQTVLADCFATYRCFVVWGRYWAAVIPAFSVISTLITGIGVVYECAISGQGEEVFVSALKGWIMAFFVLTLATNVCCTGLISFRIWFTTKKVARFSGQQSLLPVVIVIVESGAIYSLSCIILLIVYLLGSNAQYVVVDGTFPIISIAFNLIIVRIAQGISHGDRSAKGTGLSPSSGIVDAVRSHTQTNSQYPMKPIAVTVSQLVQSEGDRKASNTTSEHGDGDKDTDAMSIADDLAPSPARSDKENASWDTV